jgi:hypothetical protein
MGLKFVLENTVSVVAFSGALTEIRATSYIWLVVLNSAPPALEADVIMVENNTVLSSYCEEDKYVGENVSFSLRNPAGDSKFINLLNLACHYR